MTFVSLRRWARGWGRTYPGARGAVAASRRQLHQHKQQVGCEQADAVRGQHGASGLRAGVVGSTGRTTAPALLPSFPRGPWQRRCSAGWRRLRTERAVMNREGRSWSVSVCSARGRQSLSWARSWLQQVGCQSLGHGNSRYKPMRGAGRSPP